MRHRTHLAVGLTIVLTIAASACGEPVADAPVAPSELQTLDEFLGWDGVGPDEEYRAFVALRTTIEEMLVTCMAGRGLRYEAREAEPGGRPPVLGEGLSDREFMLQYGYGVFPGLLDEARWNAEFPPDEAGADPDVLWGEFTDDLDAYMAVLEECTTEVETELGRPDPGWVDGLSASIQEAWRPLEAGLEATERRIERDRRLTEAWEDWSGCMTAAGYDFATTDDVERYLWDEREEFQEALNLGTLVLTPAIERGVRPFIEEELAIAAADLACRGDLEALHEEVRREHEGRFIDEHRPELEEIRDLERQLMEVLLQGWQW